MSRSTVASPESPEPQPARSGRQAQSSSNVRSISASLRPRVRTYVRVRGRGDDPACRRRLLLRVGRAARRSVALRGRPVIVGAGVVLAASYEAKAYGVRTAMGGRQARRLCPDAVVVSPRMSAYSDASKALFRVFENATPVVEGLSIDEAFLDVRGMRRLRARRPTSPCDCDATRATQVGLADHRRRRTNEVPRQGRERRREAGRAARRAARPRALVPARACRSSACGASGRSRLRSCTASASRRSARSPSSDESALVAMLGRGVGSQVYALAHNRDRRRVQTGRRRGSIGAQCALGRSRTVARGGGRRARRARRSRHAPDAEGTPRRPNRRPAAAVRGLLPRDALVHAAARDLGDAGDPRDRAVAASPRRCRRSSATGSRSSA